MKTSAIKIEKNRKLKLSEIDASAKGFVESKEEAEALIPALVERIADLQEKLYAEHKQSLLLVFQAMDTGGKDGAIEKLLRGVNPAGVQVTSFKAPSSKELAHDFLWRLHPHTPSHGIIGVWNRSHYEDVLITRVRKMIDEAEVQVRYKDIVAFEELLTRSGTRVVKFFLYIDKDEQKTRLQARLDDPAKHWKFSVGDLEERKKWSDYMTAYENALSATSTKAAPWYVIPSNRKWARSLSIAQVVLQVLEEMNPQFPTVDFDPSKIVIE